MKDDQKKSIPTDSPEETSPISKIVKILPFGPCLLIILEVLWMVTPLAGFIYSWSFIGSFLQYSGTRWVGFLFWDAHHPLSWLFLYGGTAILTIAASQVYGSKIRGSGIVKGIIYKHIRHPQYLAFSMIAASFVLMWPRYTTLLAFASMLFLYIILARSEEKRIFQAHYDSYLEYFNRTSFFVPCDRYLFRLKPPQRKPNLTNISLALLTFLIMLLCFFGASLALRAIKVFNRNLPIIKVDNIYILQNRIVDKFEYMPLDDEKRIIKTLKTSSELQTLLGDSIDDGNKLFLVNHPIRVEYFITGNRRAKDVDEFKDRSKKAYLLYFKGAEDVESLVNGYPGKNSLFKAVELDIDWGWAKPVEIGWQESIGNNSPSQHFIAMGQAFDLYLDTLTFENKYFSNIVLRHRLKIYCYFLLICAIYLTSKLILAYKEKRGNLESST
ncbi:hypothetical protein KKB18_01995 [bacterium]|nr:hypothetical protein [bacterium]